MKRKKVIYILIASLSAISISSFSQQGINVCSNTTSINGLKFDYSIGEMTLVTTQKNASLIVTQGLLQPGHLKNEPAVSPAATNLQSYNEINVYPNPAKNILFIELTENTGTEINYQLFDASGKTLLSKTHIHESGSGHILMDMQSYAEGIYYLIIHSNTQEKYTYKIQKIN